MQVLHAFRIISRIYRLNINFLGSGPISFNVILMLPGRNVCGFFPGLLYIYLTEIWFHVVFLLWLKIIFPALSGFLSGFPAFNY